MNSLLCQTKLFLNRNSSTILTSVGAVGVVATSVMAVKATPKALSLLEKAEKEKGEKLEKLEVIKVAAPVYIPAVLIGVSSIACIFGANVLNKHQQASLISAYALVDNSYKEYKNKIKELYGEEADSKVREELAKDKYEETDISVDDEKQLFYDDFSERYFESSMENVKNAEYEINRIMHIDYAVSLNDFYDLLDIERTDYGEQLGWSVGQMHDSYWHSWIEFEHEKVVMDDGLECYIIRMPFEPFPEYLEY